MKNLYSFSTKSIIKFLFSTLDTNETNNQNYAEIAELFTDITKKETKLKLNTLNNKNLELSKKIKNKKLIYRLLKKPKLSPPNKYKRDILIQKNWTEVYSNPERKEHKRLIRGWERMKTLKISDGRTHLQMIYDECKKQEAPFEVVFLALHESNWHRTIGSSAGARGPWQFMKKTAKDCNLIVNSKIDERTNW